LFKLGNKVKIKDGADYAETMNTKYTLIVTKIRTHSEPSEYSICHCVSTVATHEGGSVHPDYNRCYKDL